MSENKFTNSLCKCSESSKPPIHSIFTENWQLKNEYNPPFYKITHNINVKHIKDKNKITVYFPETDINDLIELSKITIHIPIPIQYILDFSSKISYNKLGFFSLIKNIKIQFSQNDYINFSLRDYYFWLKNNFGIKEFENIFQKYFIPKNKIVLQDEYENINQVLVQEEVFNLPIFFNKPIKLWLLNQTKPFVEIHLHNVNYLYYHSLNWDYNNYSFENITASFNLRMKNHTKYFNNYSNECLTQTDLSLTGSNSLLIDKEYLQNIELNEDLNKIYFVFQDNFFKTKKLYYGESVDKSIRNFLSSCVKINSTESSFNLSNGQFSNGTNNYSNYHTEVNSNKIYLTYKDEKNEFLTIITIYPMTLIDLENIFFDIKTSHLLEIFWFKEFELNFDFYDPQYNKIDPNIYLEYNNGQSLEKAFKLINGVFVKDKLKFTGVGSYSFKKTIPFEDRFLTEKHFATYFSMPIENTTASYFSKLDFMVYHDALNIYIDLDHKYKWEISNFQIKNENESHLLLNYNYDMILNSDDDERFSFVQKLSFDSEEKNFEKDNYNQGFLNLKNFYISILIKDFEIYNIKKKINTFQLELILSYFIQNIWKYESNNFIKVDCNRIKKFSTDIEKELIDSNCLILSKKRKVV